MKRKIVSIILVFIMLVYACIYSVIAATESQLRTEISEIQDKISDAKEDQSKLKEQLTEEEKVISGLDAEISSAQAEVDGLEAQIDEVQKSISEKEKEIEVKQKEYEKNEGLLEQRLVVMYETGDTSFLDMLFSSSSLTDFISNYYTMSQLVQFDIDLLQSIEDDKNAIEEAKKELEVKKEEIVTLKNEKEEKANALKSKRAERQSKYDSLNAESKALADEIAKYNKSIDNLKEQIANLNPNTGAKFDGTFIWPCNNKIITSTVKYRWGRLHKGIDIGARYENVYASASGYAYTLTNPGGYGLYIIIYHGDGYATLYGHLNAYKISNGQYVSQGQVIAQSGNTGGSTGAHLHFEIRRPGNSNYFNASALNPLEYLPGGYTFAAGAQTPS